jgi:uncharacterized protein YukE
MSNLTGLDIEAVHNLSRDLGREAEELQRAIGDIQRLVAHSQDIWKGNDAIQFAEKWSGEYRGALQQMQRDIADLGRKAQANADRQREISSQL